MSYVRLSLAKFRSTKAKKDQRQTITTINVIQSGLNWYHGNSLKTENPNELVMTTSDSGVQISRPIKERKKPKLKQSLITQKLKWWIIMNRATVEIIEATYPKITTTKSNQFQGSRK